jgi:hypothetical protein
MLDALVVNEAEKMKERNRKAGAGYGRVDWNAVGRSNAVKARLLAGNKTYNKFRPRVH